MTLLVNIKKMPIALQE